MGSCKMRPSVCWRQSILGVAVFPQLFIIVSGTPSHALESPRGGGGRNVNVPQVLFVFGAGASPGA